MIKIFPLKISVISDSKIQWEFLYVKIIIIVIKYFGKEKYYENRNNLCNGRRNK